MVVAGGLVNSPHCLSVPPQSQLASLSSHSLLLTYYFLIISSGLVVPSTFHDALFLPPQLHFLFYILLHPAECRLVLTTCDNTVCLAVTPWLVSAKNKNQQFVPLLLLMRLTSTHIVLTSTSTSGTTSTPAGPGGSSCLLLLLMIDITPLVLTSASASTSCIPAGPGPPGSFLLCLSPPLLLSQE